MNKTLKIATATGIVLALAFSLGAIPAGMDVQAQTEPTPFPSREKTLSVIGTATTKVNPDLLVVQFGVEVQEKTAKEALDSNAQKMTAVISAIKAVGVSENQISTSQLTIYPVYESYQERDTGIYKQRLIGYAVSNIIQVETANLNMASSIIDSAVGAGVNRVNHVSFTLSPQKQTQVSDDLLTQAIENAKTKAQKALVPLNHEIIGVKHVSLSEFAYPPPSPMFRGAMEMADAKVSTPIFQSDQQVTTTASVVFIIGSK